MKHVKIIFLALMLMSGMTAVAQDSYSEALKALANVNPMMDSSLKPAEMKQGLAEVNRSLMKNYDEKTSNELVDRYLNTQFASDLIDKMMLPSFKKYVTENELREVAAQMSTPEGKTFTEETIAMLQKPEAMGELTQCVTSITASVMKGETPAPVKANSKIKKDYVELWNRFYDAGGMTVMTEQLFTGMGLQFSQSAGAKIWEKLAAPMKSNFKVMLLNMARHCVSKESLEFGIKFASLPASKHVTEASVDMLSCDMQQRGEQLIAGYGEWLEKQGVELKKEK
ncbi:MAG: hypothetical protein IJ762_08680 [Bacteroidaceae bacterium]|nr:hypothetical protein [Bacteroidaceae bacterium]